ncbi:MAG: phosphate ABC transporter substrate-binding protein PstS [Arachnia sp.]
MKMRLSAALGLSAALLLSACAANETTDPTGNEATTTDLSGTINGIGASSKDVAEKAWAQGFQTTVAPDATVNYAPEGSGAGREAFMGGGADYAGSDRAFTLEENIAGSFGKCTDTSIAYDIPVYISPVAVVFNVDGVDSLNLDATTLAAIFKGDITNWNDPAISALNEGVTFPDLTITAVHRSDESGTTENFTDYLAEIGGQVWDAEPDKAWPYEGGEAAKGTSGVVGAVTNGVGTIGYADASQAGDLGVANIGSDGTFNPPTPEAAAQLVETSPIEEGRAEHDLAIALDREGDGYPIILVSYEIVCAEYQDAATAELVKAYVSYVISDEGQAVAAENAGSAPLSANLAGQAQAAIDAVK